VTNNNPTLDSAVADPTNAGDVVGRPTPLRRYPEDIAAVAAGSLLAYRMPAVRGGLTTATAMMFVPKGPAPSNGFPLVVFCHGTEGWVASFAPSVWVQNGGHPVYGGHWLYGDWIVDLVSTGHVVVAVDYEGLGDPALGVPQTGHPYLNRSSEAYSAVYGAVAAKRALGPALSGAWAAVGHSQGGRVAIGAAEFASDAIAAEPSLDFRGGIAASPSTNIWAKLNERWAQAKKKSTSGDLAGAIPYLALINAYSFMFVRSFMTSGHDIDPSELYGERGIDLFTRLRDADIVIMLDEATKDIARFIYNTPEGARIKRPDTYPGFNVEAANRRMGPIMEANEIGRVRIPGDMLVIQGAADAYTPDYWTIELVNRMLADGSYVRLSLHAGTDHYGLLHSPHAKAIMRQHLSKLFGDFSRG
jgi:hypothetical protein